MSSSVFVMIVPDLTARGTPDSLEALAGHMHVVYNVNVKLFSLMLPLMAQPVLETFLIVVWQTLLR